MEDCLLFGPVIDSCIALLARTEKTPSEARNHRIEDVEADDWYGHVRAKVQPCFSMPFDKSQLVYGWLGRPI